VGEIDVVSELGQTSGRRPPPGVDRPAAMASLLLHCREGFEGECAAEIQRLAGERGMAGYCVAPARSARVEFRPGEPWAAHRLHATLDFHHLIFARQWFVLLEHCEGLGATDRATPLARSLDEAPGPLEALFLEHPDTNEGKRLSRLCRSLAGPVRRALAQRRPMAAGSGLRGHLCLLSGDSALAGYARSANSAPWPMGIPRLRLARQAPSRSALKLEEALLRFLTAEQRDRALAPGGTAVDLGAAPGGWTWQLVRRHLRVIAVDNGPLDPALMDSGLVEHRRESGFLYRPPRPVDWMVCDMAEQPIRVAALAAAWVRDGWCTRTVFNLKLPMKKRYDQVQRCLDLAAATLADAGIAYRLACKHLYHDREEVTVYLARAVD